MDLINPLVKILIKRMMRTVIAQGRGFDQLVYQRCSPYFDSHRDEGQTNSCDDRSRNDRREEIGHF